jgi:hypothetical protein
MFATRFPWVRRSWIVLYFLFGAALVARPSQNGGLRAMTALRGHDSAMSIQSDGHGTHQFATDAPLAMAENTVGAATRQHVPTTSTNVPRAPQPVDAAIRGKVFFSAFLMWFGVLGIGLALVAMVIFWGRRLRRSVRHEPLPTTTPDPLWYLKLKDNGLPPRSVEQRTGIGPVDPGGPST